MLGFVADGCKEGGGGRTSFTLGTALSYSFCPQGFVDIPEAPWGFHRETWAIKIDPHVGRHSHGGGEGKVNLALFLRYGCNHLARAIFFVLYDVRKEGPRKAGVPTRALVSRSLRAALFGLLRLLGCVSTDVGEHPEGCGSIFAADTTQPCSPV